MAAASLPVLQPHPILLLSPQAARGAPPLRSSLFALPRRRDQHQHLPPFHRGGGGSVEARMGPGFSDFHTTETWVRHIFERAEGVIYTVADAAVSAVSSPSEIAGAAVVEEGKKQGGDWLSGITDYMESVLKVLKDGLSALHVPYPYGFAIILLTILVKAATFPLTKKQVESAMAMRSLQPQVKAIQERYAGNQEKIQLETARLYKLAGVNPLAGCLPTLATIPVWIGLYRALSNVANEGLLTEGFFWIPSLAGPTTIAARQSGSGISWLFPFVDGHPPLGWSDTLAYLVLPALLIVSQYTSAQMMQPTQGNDPSQKSSQALTKILPLMIGYFALSVPSGLSLYWFTNNVLSTAQQIWLQKLGGAKNPVKEYNDRIQEPLPDIQTIQPNNQKTGLEVDSVREKTSQEKANSGGPRPGERFKQIKEQEARKRREKEEAMKRAEAAKGSNVNSEESNLEIYSKSTLQVESSSVKVTEGSQSVSPAPDLLKDDPLRINGSDSKQGTKEDKTNTYSSATSNGGLSRNVDVTGAQDSPPDIQNDESVEIRSSSGNQTSEPYHEQIDQAGETDKD